jgi:hypothetical protein
LLLYLDTAVSYDHSKIGAKTFSVTTFRITTLSIMCLFVTLSITVFSVIMLSVAFIYCYVECRYAECRYAECHGAKGSSLPYSQAHIVTIVTYSRKVLMIFAHWLGVIKLFFVADHWAEKVRVYVTSSRWLNVCQSLPVWSTLIANNFNHWHI